MADGLVLIVPDGVEGEAEAGRVEPGEGERASDREPKREVIEEQPDIAELGRRIGGEHAGARPDPGNACRDLARGDAETEGADGEIMPAHRQHERAEQPGDQRACQRGGGKAEREAGQELRLVEQEGGATALGLGIGADIVKQPDLDDGRHIHADADEQHVAEGVVAHLPADQVPGKGEYDEEQKLGRLRLIGGCGERHDHAQRDEPRDEQEASQGEGGRAQHGAPISDSAAAA